jgi:hypothetical protein
MPQRAVAAVLLALLLGAAAVPGCTSRHHADTDKEFTLVYAELMLLTEQEKIVHGVSDSTYHVKSDSLLKKHGLTEEEFKQRSDVLMTDDRVWRDFLGGVTLAFDSIKTARSRRPG